MQILVLMLLQVVAGPREVGDSYGVGKKKKTVNDEVKKWKTWVLMRISWMLMQLNELDANISGREGVTGMSVDKSESKGGRSRGELLSQRAHIGGGKRTKDDLETAMWKEIASFLNFKKFYVGKDTRHKI